MRKYAQYLALFALPITSACVSTPIMGDPAVTVTASAETAPVGTVKEDAADDPAIWRNPVDPAKSLIVATDKKAGLYVYNLSGETMSFIEGGLLNNVDLVDLGEAGGVIVVASDRTDPSSAKLRIFRLDTRSGTLEMLGRAEGGPAEGYGLCLHQSNGAIIAYSVLKNGLINEYSLNLESNPSSTLMRSMKVATQPEGCVVDPRNGALYVGEENTGIWRFDRGQSAGTLVAAIDNAQLVADVEGLAIAPDGEDGGFLIASSQGDNAFARYRLPDMTPAGRFRIVAGEFGGAEETDGIALDMRDFGSAFPKGLFVAQDGLNAPASQNFKLVRWDRIETAMEAGIVE